MSILSSPWRLAALVALAAAAGGQASDRENELVANPKFTAVDEKGVPAHWSVWSPEWQPASCRMRGVADGLLVDAPDRPYAVGGLWRISRASQRARPTRSKWSAPRMESDRRFGHSACG